jgi:hypothetical protein
VFKTMIGRDVTGFSLSAYYKHSRVKQYLKDGRALRIETVINSPTDLGCLRRLTNLDELQTKARAINTRVLDAERVGQALSLPAQPLRGWRSPPSPTVAGGPRPYGSATLGSRPWPAPCAPPCSPPPASPTRACAPVWPDSSASITAALR